MHKIFLGKSFSKKLLPAKSKLDNISLEILCEQKFFLRIMLLGKNISERKQNHIPQKDNIGFTTAKSIKDVLLTCYCQAFLN